MTHRSGFIAAFMFGAVSAAGAALAHPHDPGDPGANHDASLVHENGIGPDPDNDTNPATDTGGISLVGDASDAADDPPYAVITFEAPPGKHGDKIEKQYSDDGVTFGRGLTRQICVGQRHFQYDSMCTYEAAPSGAYAAGYLHYLNAPLKVSFARPVCVVTMAIYPTGGKEGEPFQLQIDGWDANDKKLPRVQIDFTWTKDTVRWRHMAGAYYLDERAQRIEISMRSKDGGEARETLRFLIDDFAFVEDNCDTVVDALKAAEAKPQ